MKPIPRMFLMLSPAGALALAFGWPTLHADFTSGDDQRFVTDHFLVSHPSWENAGRLLGIVHGDLYQPIPMLTFQANYALASPRNESRFGVDPFGFHLTNVILHAINAALATLLARRISGRDSIAVLTGLMFACHPFAMESVAWVSGRMMLLATVFSLTTVLLFLGRDQNRAAPARKRSRHDGDPVAISKKDALKERVALLPRLAAQFLAILAWAFALLSKVIPTIPLAAAVVKFTETGKLSRRSTTTLVILLALSSAGIAGAFYTSRSAGFVNDESEFNSSPGQNFLFGSWYYLRSFIVPTKLSPWVPPPFTDTVREAETPSLDMFGITVALGAFLCLPFISRRVNPTVFIGLVTFVILLAPFLLAPSARRFIAADRYMYLPIFGLHLAIAGLMIQVSDRLDEHLRPSFRHRYLVLPSALLLAFWLYLSWAFSATWKDTLSRDRRIATAYPDNPLSHYELAKAHNFEGQPRAALDIIEKARERWPENPRLAAQAGEAHWRLNQWEAAEKELAFAVEQMPRHSTTRYHHALALAKLARHDEAVTELNRILEFRPDFLPALTALGRIHTEQGDRHRAEDALDRALRLNPNSRTALFQFAEIRMSQRRWTEAINFLRRIQAVDPRDAKAKFNLAICLVNTGESTQAAKLYDELIEKDPTNVTLRLNRAGVAAHLGATEKAETDYLFVATERPDLIEAYVGLHTLLSPERRFGRILEVWQFRADKLGRTPETQSCLVWGFVLTGTEDTAETMFAALPSGSNERLFAAWAFSIAALRRGEGEPALVRVQVALEERSAAESQPSGTPEWQMRIVESALNDLPREIKDSEAGKTALRLFLRYAGQSARRQQET